MAREVIYIAMITVAVAWGQASVDETKETAFIHVDGVHGSDSNSGTQQYPFRTLTKGLNAALAKSAAGTGARVTVLPGTYRESMIVSGSASAHAPVTVQAATPDTVIISGADVWNGWQVYAGNTLMLTHPWPYQWGTCVDSAIPAGHTLQPIVLRREMIFVNTEPLTQVLSLSQMREGTFYVNEGNHTAYIWPPSGRNIGTATIEVAVRPVLLTGFANSSLVFRGLSFQYANSCRGVRALSFSNSSNILFDSVNIVWNNAGGLGINGSNHVTVKNSKANHNGEVGWTAYKVTQTEWSSNEGSYNNWRGAQGANYDLTTQGGHFLFTHSSTFTGLTTVYNLAHGVHWDTDAVNINAESILSANNYRSGAVIEASEGPVTIQTSHICYNNIANLVGGLNLTDASRVTLKGNTLYDNLSGQIVLGGRPGGTSVTNWETGQTYQVYNDHLTATSNAVVGAGTELVFQDSYLSSEWDRFVSTLTSEYNLWWNANNPSSFMVSVPRGSMRLNLAGWQNLTHQDAHSVYTGPSPARITACQVSPDLTDYWLVVDHGTRTVSAGNSATFMVSVIPLAFIGIVSLSVDATGVPVAGASYSKATINTSGSSTLTVSTSKLTPPGSYPITMIAENGSLTKTITVSVVVTM